MHGAVPALVRPASIWIIPASTAHLCWCWPLKAGGVEAGDVAALCLGAQQAAGSGAKVCRRSQEGRVRDDGKGRGSQRDGDGRRTRVAAGTSLVPVSRETRIELSPPPCLPRAESRRKSSHRGRSRCSDPPCGFKPAVMWHRWLFITAARPARLCFCPFCHRRQKSSGIICIVKFTFSTTLLPAEWALCPAATQWK